MSDAKDLFEREAEDEFQKKAKSEEEIQKMCTKEDMTELQRAVFLLRKGYEIQKLSVINNLFRYSREVGANEDLLSLIINSLEDWDSKMQIECAQGFLQPLRDNLLTNDNKRNLLKQAVQIITNECNDENEALRDSWIECYDAVIGKVDFDYVKLVAVKAIAELNDRKSTLPRRKLGNILLSSLIKNCGEKAIDAEKKVLQLMLQSCRDTNYKIRIDGATFFKEYLAQNHQELRNGTRLRQTYIPEILDLINDSDIFIKIEAIEALKYVLETVDVELIEREFVPSLLKLLNIDTQHDEINTRMAEVVGPIAFKMQKIGDLHVKYQKQILGFYRDVCTHKNDECRLPAALNFPCMNQIYRNLVSPAQPEESKDDEPEQSQFTFNEACLEFAQDSREDIRIITANSIHEAFLAATDDEDTSALRTALHELLGDESLQVQTGLLRHLDTVINRYANNNTVASFSPEQQVRVELPERELTIASQKKTIEKSSTVTNKKPIKRSTTSKINTETAEQEDTFSGYIFLSEWPKEHIYSFLLYRLIVYKQALSKRIAMWRDYCTLLEKLTMTISHFHLPEVHDRLVVYLFDDIHKGNNQIRKSVCRLLVKIFVHQHCKKRREELAAQVTAELARSESFQKRKVFLQFCRESAGEMPRQTFEDHFYPAYLALCEDKVANVRLEFARSLIDVKPFIEANPQVHSALIDSITKLKKDTDREVAEATDQADFQLLKSRKKTLEVISQKEEACVGRQKRLAEREALEADERKKRAEEDDQYEYLGSYGAAARNGLKAAAGKKAGIRAGPSTSSTGVTAVAKTNRKVSGTAAGPEKSTAKRKTATGSSKSSALPEPNTHAEAPKRKQSLLLPAQNSTPSQAKAGAIEPASNYKRSNSSVIPGKPSGAAPKRDSAAHLNNSNKKQKQPHSKQSNGDSSSSNMSDDDLNPSSYAKYGGGTRSTT